MNRVAVTGGGGFIGRATVEAARRAGYEAWAFDRREGQDILGKLKGLDGADHVIHLAGILGTSELFDDPHGAVDINVHGTMRILEWCAEHGASYVGITMHDIFPSVYTATKICAMRMATAWHHAYDVGVSHVRAYNAYGPGQAYGPGHPQKILPTFARAAWEGRPIPIWGDGEQTVDLVHSDDVAQMLVDALRFNDDAMFEAGTGVALTVNEVAAKVLEVTGSKAGVEYLPMRPGEIPSRIVAHGEGWDRLDWKPEHDWDRVAKAVESYQ